MTNENKIVLLDESVYNKIAAGEVVGRPASVVKELLENAIDAGARNITVVMKDAGKKLIRVTDDGEGMSEKDALLSIKRHATSKIRTAEDLERIGTFGFRGEALSSVAAVSNLSIKTRRNEDELGVVVTVDEHGNAKAEKEALPQGTSVIVKNLFYNVPARKNFLKSNQTEFKNIAETFNRIAVAYPEIAFKLYRENSLYADYPSAGFRERMQAVFGEQISDLTIEFEENTDYIAAFGFIAKPTYLTDSKNKQYLFVNGRYVKNKTVNNAVFAAYENLLAKGEYPFFVLFLTIDTKMIDVNVHPAKEEIKFHNDAEIYAFVKSVIKKALGGYDYVPDIKTEERKNDEKLKVVVSEAKKSRAFARENKGFGASDVTSDDELELLFGAIDNELANAENSTGGRLPFSTNKNEDAKTETRKTKRRESGMIFYAHKKYIVTQIKSGLMLIDVNRAHRRILFEKAFAALKKGVPFSQQLLFAQTFQLRKDDFETLQKYDEKLTRLGFEIKYYAKQTVSIVGVPSDIKLGSEAKNLLGILNALKEYGEGNVDKIIAETYARQAAIKEGEELSENELHLILDQLFATSEPQFSPEGEKTFVKITLNRLEEMFGGNSRKE